jgi:hypothetical protein
MRSDDRLDGVGILRGYEGSHVTVAIEDETG